ncbi:MAG: hypothetical protein LBD29_00540, partial [Treponema sp.]|nr:hypothetical protein [Treponema sp.]
MKRTKWFLKGILGVALGFMLVISGCSNDSDDDGGDDNTLTAPGADDLPALPAGTAAIANETDAKALLNAIEEAQTAWAVSNPFKREFTQTPKSKYKEAKKK